MLRSPVPDTPPADEPPPKFRLYLTHMPGPYGRPLINVVWRIVQAPDATAALRAKAFLLTGKTGADGMLDLKGQDPLLAKAYSVHPWPTWIVYGSKVRRLDIAVEDDSWTSQDKRDHAMDGMGFSDGFQNYSNGGDDQDGHIFHAMRQMKVRDDDSLFQKYKGT